MPGGCPCLFCMVHIAALKDAGGFKGSVGSGEQVLQESRTFWVQSQHQTDSSADCQPPGRLSAHVFVIKS